jgi:hypothetical protein
LKKTEAQRKRSRKSTKKSIWSKADRDRFVGYIDKWRGLLLMNGWHIDVTFSETAYRDTEKAGGFDPSCSASMTANGAYMSGHHLTIFPHMIDGGSDLDEQERKIVHELVHIITQPQKDITRRLFSDKFVTWAEATDANERATDWIANVVWALKEDQDEH